MVKVRATFLFLMKSGLPEKKTEVLTPNVLKFLYSTWNITEIHTIFHLIFI